jgi:hypothetical protein
MSVHGHDKQIPARVTMYNDAISSSRRPLSFQD